MSTTQAPGGRGAMEQPLLLITGAAGRIGTYYRGHLASAQAHRGGSASRTCGRLKMGVMPRCKPATWRT